MQSAQLCDKQSNNTSTNRIKKPNLPNSADGDVAGAGATDGAVAACTAVVVGATDGAATTDCDDDGEVRCPVCRSVGGDGVVGKDGAVGAAIAGGVVGRSTDGDGVDDIRCCAVAGDIGGSTVGYGEVGCSGAYNKLQVL